MPTEVIGLKQRYDQDVRTQLQKHFEYANMMQVPTIHKVVVNVGLGEAVQTPKVIDAAMNDLALIAGQKAIVRRAKKSIAAFKLRTGMPVGAKTTLRGSKMWDFLDRLINLALPRVRDFRGLPTKFDGRGNFSLGLREQLIFPEIDYDKVDKIRGMNVSIVTTARTDAEAKELLRLLGMPFRD